MILQIFLNIGWYYKIVLSSGIIISLCLWSQRNAPLPTLADCLATPSAYDGKLLSTNAGGKVESVEEWGFWLRNRERRIRVLGDVPDLRVGDTVFLEAVFHKEGYLELQRVYVSRYRYLRIWVSLQAMAWVIWIFLRRYRFDWVRRVFFQRM